MSIRLTRPIGAALLTLGLGACFNSFGLENAPCQTDEDCGPSLFCVNAGGEMICVEDPSNPSTTNASGESGTSSGSETSDSDSTDTEPTDTETDPTDTETDPTDPTETDPTDPTETDPTDTDTGGCLEPLGECSDSTVPLPAPTDNLEELVSSYCQTYTQCGCEGFESAEECESSILMRFELEQTLSTQLGTAIDPMCLGFRLAFLDDLGCRPERGINPPLDTVQACDGRSCPIWTGTVMAGQSCEGGVGENGNPINSTCQAPLICNEGTCEDPCTINNPMPPVWAESPDFRPPGICGDPQDQCSVCNTCNDGMCGSPSGSDCQDDDDCGVAGYCDPDHLCQARHIAGECCAANKQCLSGSCQDGACAPEPYICVMPFPSAYLEFP